MWAVGRRSGFFIVSYAPLAAMFVVLKWPEGWAFSELAALGFWLVAVAVLVLLVPSLATVTGSSGRIFVGFAVLAAAVAFALGLVFAWYEPMSLHPAKPKTAATASGIAYGLFVLALLIVALIMRNAHRAGEVRWTVTDPRDQGGAVAGYLATYLLPLLDTSAHGWRVTAAYAIYLSTLYLVFIRSESLILVNPTLYALNYRIYDVEIDARDPADRRRVLMVTKSPLTTTTQVDAVPLGDRCYLAKEVSS